MTAIRMEHAQHGVTNVYSILEQEAHEKNGWRVQQLETQVRQETAEEVKPVKRRGRPPKDNHGSG